MADHVDADHCNRHHTYYTGCRYNINNASRQRWPLMLRPGQGVRLNNLVSRLRP